MSVQWKFPKQEFFMMKVEVATLVLMGFIVFLFTLLNIGSVVFGVIFTALFISIYVVVAYFVQLFRKIEEHYHLTPLHLTIKRKRGSKVKEVKVAVKDIHHHKLDRMFLGGYVLTKDKKKHVLFFNSEQELEQFETLVKKHVHKKPSKGRPKAKKSSKKQKPVRKRTKKR